MSCRPLFRTYLNPLDRFILRGHERLYNHYKWKAVLLSLAVYVLIILLFSDSLRISCNYFVLIPLMASALSYGSMGGSIAGFFSLALNLFMFRILGHPEYAPDNLLIAFVSGASVGLIMGYLSDYFHKLNDEMERRSESEEQLKESLSDKDLLLREINHRVRNNLGIIGSLIQLQANRAGDRDSAEPFEKLKQRVFSISLVHEQLFMENQPLVLDVRSYLEVLLDNLLKTNDELDISLVIDNPASPMPLKSDRVLHLGLIVQEVVMNSIKYAFTPTSGGSLSLGLSRDGDSYFAEIQDSGAGFEPDSVFQGLGIQLIKSLALSLNGEASWDCRNGCLFVLSFPVS